MPKVTNKGCVDDIEDQNYDGSIDSIFDGVKYSPVEGESEGVVTVVIV